jgi:hypothetical protein
VIVDDVMAKVVSPAADPVIGATGDDQQAPQKFVPLASNESASRYLAIAAWFTVLVISSMFAGLRRARRHGFGAIVESDAAISYRRQNRQGWGDRLPIFKWRFMTALDQFSFNAIRVAYPKSPVLAKIFNEGAYLRAFFGSLTSLGAIAGLALGVTAALTRDKATVVPSVALLMVIVVLGVIDAFPGLLATFAMTTTTLVTMHSASLNDYRTLLGLFTLGFTPVIAAEAFRTIRRKSERSWVYRWERISDAAISPFIAGLTTTAIVSLLPGLAGVTLAVANHAVAFGVLAAAVMLVRVLLEELAAKAYPERMDKLNPVELREPSRMQEITSLAFKVAVYIFTSTAIFGLTWEVWLACAFFAAPALVKIFENKLPNSRTIWLWLPKGIPGMATSLIVALIVASNMSVILQKPILIARYGFIVLGVVALAFTVLHALGRHGRVDELRPIQNPNRKYAYRIGGVLVYALTVGLALSAG